MPNKIIAINASRIIIRKGSCVTKGKDTMMVSIHSNLTTTRVASKGDRRTFSQREGPTTKQTTLMMILTLSSCILAMVISQKEDVCKILVSLVTTSATTLTTPTSKKISVKIREFRICPSNTLRRTDTTDIELL